MAERRSARRGSRPTTRRLVQLYAALLYNAHAKGFIQGEIYQGYAKAVCVPGLNCYSCPGAVGACPLGALQNALAASGHRAGWYVFGILLLFGITLGRTICGWLCPIGLLQELLYKVPGRKVPKSRATRVLSGLKYAVLAVFAIALPLWYGLRQGLAVPAFCKYICPAGTLEGALALLAGPARGRILPMLGGLFTGKLAVLGAVVLACLFCYRSFCRFLCPLGAIYSLFNRYAIVGVRVDADRCNSCGACVRHCEMDVRRVGDRECISCGKCMAGCAQQAISLKCGRITLMGPESSPRAKAPLWLRMVLPAVLIGAFVWFNGFDRPVRGVQTGGWEADGGQTAAQTTGWEVGEALPDFTCVLPDGTEFHLAEHRGEVVMINLWATYCAPCVRELDFFNRLKHEHPEIVVLAAHASLVTEPVEEYLAGKDWDALTFAVDADDVVTQAIHGSSLLPQTVVLDRNGTVIYNQAGSVTYEQLVSLWEEAAGIR